MLDPANDPWLVGEINKLLEWVNVGYIQSRCVLRQQPNGRERYVFRPRLDVGDIRAFSQPWRNRIQVTWFSAATNDTERVGLFLDAAEFSFDANGVAQVHKSFDQIFDAKFGALNWAYIESTSSARGGKSAIQMIQRLVEDHWPLTVDPTKRRGPCRGITNDILRGVPVQGLLAQQRQRNARMQRPR